MTPTSKRARARHQDLALEAAAEIPAGGLRRVVVDRLLDDGQLAAYVDVGIRADAAAQLREGRVGCDDVAGGLAEASRAADVAAEQRSREVIAQACAAVLEDADGWEWTAEDESEARYEARTWLQSHLEFAEQVGVDGVEREEARHV